LVGHNELGTITNSFATGNVTGTGYYVNNFVGLRDPRGTIIGGGAISITINPPAATLTPSGTASFAVTTRGFPGGTPIILYNPNNVSGIAIVGSPIVDASNTTSFSISTTAATPTGTHTLALQIGTLPSALTREVAQIDLTVNAGGGGGGDGDGGCNVGLGMFGALALVLWATRRRKHG